MAQVLDDGDNLRVLPIVTYGAASNLDDLLYLRGVDVAITQSDVFEYFRTQRKTANLEGRIHYIMRLPISELHLLAKTAIKSIEDLRGKKVNFDPAGSASSLTGSVVSSASASRWSRRITTIRSRCRSSSRGNRRVDPCHRQADRRVREDPESAGLHFVAIPFSKKFADFYTLGELTSQEYPGLVPAGQTVDTIAVPSVLAVFNWPRNHERYRRVARFVEALYAKWDKFQQPPRHPKWKDVNLAATVPGWTRWSVAEDMLRKARQDAVAEAPTASGEFTAFLKTKTAATETPEQREALFHEFLQWQQQRQRIRQGLR
jgi:hypothetical protein